MARKNQGLFRRLKPTGLTNNALWTCTGGQEKRNDLDDFGLAAGGHATYWVQETTLEASFCSDSESR